MRIPLIIFFIVLCNLCYCQTSECNFKFTADSSLINKELYLSRFAISITKKRIVAKLRKKSKCLGPFSLMKINEESFKMYYEDICIFNKYKLVEVEVFAEPDKNKQMILYFHFELNNNP
jgi:hypothetical protein